MDRRSECGFIFLETALGLPLMIMLLWAMAHLFADTWKNFRYLIADFTMQMEVQNAMQRIVDDLRTARSVEKSQDGVLIHSNVIAGSNTIYKTINPNYNPALSEEDDSDDEKTLSDKLQPVFYFSASKSNDSVHPSGWRYIYRQRKLGAKSQPLTGGDVLSDVNAQLLFNEIAPHLWSVTINATSGVSGHKFTLKTAVYVEGAE